MSQRLFQHHTAVLVDHAGIAQLVADTSIQRWQGGQVIEPTRCFALIQQARQGLVVLGAPGIDPGEKQALPESLPDRFVPVAIREEFLQVVTGLLAKCIGIYCSPTGGYDAVQAIGEFVSVQLEQGWQQLARGQISGAAENNQINLVAHTFCSPTVSSSREIVCRLHPIVAGNRARGDSARSFPGSCWSASNNSKQSTVLPQ